MGFCEGGFLGTACGEGGTACVNCSALGESCNTGATPRTCLTQCPTPYPGCGAGVTESIATPQHVCTANELANAAAACANGATTAGCEAYMSFEQGSNPACFACLSPFDYDFNIGLGIIACASPYIASTAGPACLHTTGCYADCETQSCASCGDPTTTSTCEQNVQMGQCGAFTQPTVNCVLPALRGPASFCQPNTYPNFGAWFQAIGQRYCGP
jgi:hypothetical protein